MSVAQKKMSTVSLKAKRWKARKYQQYCVDQGILKKYLAFFLDPGLGKTSILLQIFNKLLIRKQVKAMLVVAPINPCYLVWPQEIKEWTNFRRLSYTILHGPKKNENFKKEVDIYIINPEGLKWLASKLKGKPRKNWPFDMLVVDESGKFKTPGYPNTGSNRTYQMHRMIPGFKRRYIANGSPVANGYLGLMSQMKIVDQGQSLGGNIGAYKETYFEKFGNPQYNLWRLAGGSEKRIRRKISKFAISLRAEDHVDMPGRITKKVNVELPPKAMKTYLEMEKELFTILDDTELVAESAASVANKLHQICNGRIYEDQDPLAPLLASSKRKTFEVHKEKLYALENIIEEFNGKQILIGCNFKHDRIALEKHFKKQITFFEDAKKGVDKVKIQNDWNSGKIRMLAGNPTSIGHGLNLQKGSAHVVVFYSLIHDYDSADQFIRRLYRSGSKAETVFVCYIAAKDLYDDVVVYENNMRKGQVQDSFLRALYLYRRTRMAKSS